MGPPVAAQAVPTNVTITQENESRSVRRSKSGYRQILINESPTIGGMGYRVSDGRLHGEYGLIGSDSYARWNPSSKVLTLPDVNRTNGLLGFKFESQNPVPDPEYFQS